MIATMEACGVLEVQRAAIQSRTSQVQRREGGRGDSVRRCSRHSTIGHESAPGELLTT